MLEQIISKFCNNSKFINDLDGVIKYLEDLDYEDKNKVLSEVFLYNSKMYSLLVEENKKLEHIVTRTNMTKERKEMPSFNDEIIQDENPIQIISLDVDLYVKNIKNCENLDKLKDLISNKVSINTMIILKLVEEMYDIKMMLFQDRKNIDSDTKTYFENEVEKLKIKIEYLKQLNNKETKQNIETNVDNGNELIFLKTNYGNICAYSDIKDIPSENYDLFYGLLESIRLGTFKNVKMFAEIDGIKDLSEVKDSQARVVFDRIGKNTYVIISMFVKKVDSNAIYRASIINRSDLYIQNKDTITSLALTNEEYLEENRQIKNKIYSILKKEDKVKKRGEISG